MNRTWSRLCSALALVLVSALNASAQGQGKTTSMGISGGGSMPIGDLKNATNTGFVVTGHFFYRANPSNALSYRFDVAYDKWAGKATSVEASFSSLAFSANAVVKGGSRASTVRPYALGGVGMFKTKFDGGRNDQGLLQENTNLGVQAGAGLDIPLNGLIAFVEVRYVNAFVSPTHWSWMPVSVGIHF